MNSKRSQDYIRNQANYELPRGSYFNYGKKDLQILWITRQLKGLFISSQQYFTLFQSSLEKDYPGWLNACIEAELISSMQDSNNGYRITPKGVFYSDSITGLLAQKRIIELIKRSNIASGGVMYFHNNALQERMG